MDGVTTLAANSYSYNVYYLVSSHQNHATASLLLLQDGLLLMDANYMGILT
jgi:hypothetical protein